ncbi:MULTISPECIES: efflux RND transporter permease subunit [unclassified Leptolyngbya]|uniref:efflux RND transporter permease subunit n=1 Tax=unclassified Leptolyngbya TaxID=2650499 RepID=UPI001682B587|nr:MULTISPECIES: efflux RND transporter permease subunit [unclassified Leptolyngbya]MBD1913357.1 efflux RND transporter permease subunit [Leptolyngbya sp. FACHB-8]MBD2158712.1 efflux RND transporter permease subunit [Leptolyngbya sp. FACHB-16]
MSFNISAWSIRSPVPTIVLFLVLTVAGLVAYPFLGIDQNPNVDVPAVTVSVAQPGADPSELESQVTKPVEDAVASLGNIDEIVSTVNDGLSTTTVNFVLGTDSDRATNDVRNAISQIRQDLPEDINEPVVERVDFATGGPVVTYAVVSPQRSVTELSTLVDEEISRALLAVSGVAQVNRIGGVDQEIRIDLNPARLEALSITATQVNEQVRAFNTNLPGGRTTIGDSEQTIRTLGSAPTVEALSQYQVSLPQGGFVSLSSLGTVTSGTAEVRQTARLNNQPVVAFSVLRSNGSILVAVEEGVREAIATLQQTLPSDIKLELINNVQAQYIRESYAASVEAVVLGAVLAVVTIWVFLRDWRATLITAVALPLSLIPTFAILKAFGYTLNNMTLLALALVVGILVDDAIVEIENIERHMQMGKSPFRAALDASDEIGLAVVATTMSIVAVFGPVAFMTGVVGQYFRPFGVTVAASVLFSLLVARMVTPLMAAYLLKDHRHKSPTRKQRQREASLQRGDRPPSPPNPLTPNEVPHGGTSTRPERQRRDRLVEFYHPLLRWSLRHRVTALAIALGFFIASLLLLPSIPVGLFGREDLGLATISMELPPGSTLEDTDRATQQLTRLLLENPNVSQVQTDEQVNSATLYVKLKPKGERESQPEFENEFRPQFSQIPGVRLSFSRGGPGGSRELSVVLKSEDPNALTQTANALEKEMRQVPGLVEVVSTASLVKPELLIRPDPVRAADQGVTVQEIAGTAYLATLGGTEASLAKFNLPDRQIPIRVQIDPRYRNDLGTIENLQVRKQDDTLIPLQTVADISFGSDPSQIDRYNRSRQITVEANLQGIALGNALQQVNALPALQNKPASVQQERAGNAKIMRELFGNVGAALAAAVVFIFAVLVLLFNDFLHPLTIMVALPFSLGGAFVGLLLTGKEIGLYALIGIVLLMGLVTKNSILLVDYAILNQKEGKPLFQAVLDAGVARLRPILMTTIAMIAGMLPIAMGLGAGSEVRSPMAIAVIGGLTTSTLLTLVIVPVIFTYIERLKDRIFERFLHDAVRRRAQDQDGDGGEVGDRPRTEEPLSTRK